MPHFEVKQPSQFNLTSYSGMALIGQSCQVAEHVDLRFVEVGGGLLSPGKSDFEAIEPFSPRKRSGLPRCPAASGYASGSSPCDRAARADRRAAPVPARVDANQAFLVGENEELSKAEPFRWISAAFEATIQTMPALVLFQRPAAALLGKGAMNNRLFGSLQVDISKARKMSCGAPLFSVDEGLSRAARDSRMDL